MSANTTTSDSFAQAEELVSKLSEKELVNIKDIVDYSDLIIRLLNGNNELRHQLVVKLQREVFILAFKEWVKDNYNKQLTNEEIETLRKEFKVKDDFEPDKIKLQGEQYKTHSHSILHSVFDLFISCDSVASDKLCLEHINERLVVGLSQSDLQIPTITEKYRKGVERVIVSYDTDDVWLKLIVDKDIDKINSLVQANARVELQKFVNTLKQYDDQVKQIVESSPDAKTAWYNDLISGEQYDHLFNEYNDVITSSGLDWTFKFALTFKNYEEAYKNIEYIKTGLWRNTEFSKPNWLYHKYRSDLLSLTDVVGNNTFHAIRSKFSDFKFQDVCSEFEKSQDLNHKYNTC